MRIRRKVSKPHRAERPLFIVGFSAASPALPDLASWFDLEYGGPIRLRELVGQEAETDIRSPLAEASHGPWTAMIRLSLSVSEAEEWKDRLGWRHPLAASVSTTSSPPAEVCNTILHASRLARGITLLTEGTSYDLAAQSFLNPSDWRDQALDQFHTGDHVRVVQAETPDAKQDWFSTRGLSKFGLDEIETFRPLGLPPQPVLDTLIAIADEIVRTGRSPKVGSTMNLEQSGVIVQVVRHRTVPSAGIPLIYREITWRSSDAESQGL